MSQREDWIELVTAALAEAANVSEPEDVAFSRDEAEVAIDALIFAGVLVEVDFDV